MSISCGTCHQRHDTIADVRACAEHYVAPTEPVAAAEERPKATEPQVTFVLNLYSSKVLPDGMEPRPMDVLETLPRKGAGSISEIIEVLLKQPSKPREKETSLPDVPAGRYAIHIDGTIKFYHVDRPTEGRWKGYTFLKVQASDELHPIKNPSVRNGILDMIAQDPGAAMLLYGREIGKCGHCGRTLTNKESRDAGIGPICSGKFTKMFTTSDDVPEWTLS